MYILDDRLSDNELRWVCLLGWVLMLTFSGFSFAVAIRYYDLFFSVLFFVFLGEAVILYRRWRKAGSGLH